MRKLITFGLLIMLQSPSIASEPSIKLLMDKFGQESLVFKSVLDGEGINVFPRFLNKSEKEILNYVNSSARKAYGSKLISKYINSASFQMLYFQKTPEQQAPFLPEGGVYIFENKVNIGYCIFESKLVLSDESSNILNSIKKLSTFNPGFISDINVPPEVSLTFYKKILNGKLEVYAMAESTEGTALIMDAFYPQQLENQLTPIFIQEINNNLKNFTYSNPELE